MGNYKFRLSDMIPNAWFYKLKAISHEKGNKSQNKAQSATRSHLQPPRTPKVLPNASQPELLPSRTSYYNSGRAEVEDYCDHALHFKAASDAKFLLLDSPRRTKKRVRRKPSKASPSDAKMLTSSNSAGCGCRSRKAESITEFLQPASPESASCPHGCYVDGEPSKLQETVAASRQLRDAVVFAHASDVIINVRAKSSLMQKVNDADMVPQREPPLILTKPHKREADIIKLEHKNTDDKTTSHHNCNPYERQNKSHTRRSPPGLQGPRMRVNSPRLSSRKLQAYHGERTKSSLKPTATAMQQQKKRVSFFGSFTVVKSSSDPQRDFRDSMMEMIVENNMRTSKELEELLACYLLLNSKECHDLIVEAFEQLWFDITTNVKL